MMQFGETSAHTEITEAIKDALRPHGIAGLRADDKQYHDDLFPNVMTYIYGCGFGVAVFEHLEAKEFNPNVALEVGYMFGLRKPVCLLKDKVLSTLPTDLIGRLYKEFDSQDPIGTIPKAVSEWLSDKGIILLEEELTILLAIWSAEGQTLDHTEYLNSLISDGRLEIRAHIDQLKDPAYMVRKKLQVLYAHAGRIGFEVVEENGLLILP